MHLTSLAAEYGDKPAVIIAETHETLSYRDLEGRSNRVAHVFHERDLRPGSHIAILMDNRIEMLIVAWAAQRSGLLYTPVNWHLSPDEAAYVVDNCGAEVLVHSAELAGLARQASEHAPALRERLVVGGEAAGSSDLDALAVAAPPTPVADEREGYYMFYSSGTTGRPKGILPALTGSPFGTGLPIDSMMAAGFGFSADSVYLSTGPLYHAAPLGWTMGTVRNGGTAVVMRHFDAERSLAAIDEYRVTHAQFVPTMFVRMLKLPADRRGAYDVTSLRVAVHAAAPCPPQVKQRMIEWFGPVLVEFYSGSEGNGFCMITSAEWLDHRGSVGRAAIGTVHICDETGRELPAGEVGTVWFSGGGRFEYHGDPEKTADAYDDRGWSTIGDLGHLDDDGYLYLSARRSDLILSGGVNIYPQEIENVLTMHPKVLDVAVIGVPDNEMGQRVQAVVEPADGVDASEELARELTDYCRDRLAHFKAPRTVVFDSIPRLATGKLLRRELITRYDAQAPSSSQAAAPSTPPPR